MRALCRAFCRQSAFNVAIAGWIPCGAIFAVCALFLAREEDGLQVCTSGTARTLPSHDNSMREGVCAAPVQLRT